MKIPFIKPPKTYAEHVHQLQQRGMEIDDEENAACILQHINYYRLTAYWLTFELDHATHQFRPGTTFAKVLHLYQFDKKLRLLLLDGIEQIEISVRTQWAYHIAHNYGSHAHLEAFHFDKYWSANKNKMAEEVDRSTEHFIYHLKNKYQEELPPVWAVCEVMSLGLLSRWYKSLRRVQIRQTIADSYSIHEEVLASWLHHLSLIRNTCAHHGRLWNREFTVTPKMPKNKPHTLSDQFHHGSRRVYNTLVCMAHLLKNINPKNDWNKKIIGLIDSYAIDVSDMGFPEDWRSRKIWGEE